VLILHLLIKQFGMKWKKLTMFETKITLKNLIWSALFTMSLMFSAGISGQKANTLADIVTNENDVQSLGVDFNFKGSVNDLNVENNIGNYLPGKNPGIEITVDASKPTAKIQPTMYGIFFEDINFAADGGLYAEMVKNRGFEFTLPETGWWQPNSNRHSLNLESGLGTIITSQNDPANQNFLRIVVNNPAGYQLINEGFRGMGIKAGDKYDISLKAALQEGNISKIDLRLTDTNGVVLGETSIQPSGNGWKKYTSVITATKTCENAQLQITFNSAGTIGLDMISMFPQDTWKGRKGGLRKDIVQLLYDLKPGFLRFPGGCIVEGRTIDQRYQWKKTIGTAEEREVLINRWNDEFAHRPTPDYYQSFGLGFFEYFQLAEDIGAEPLPILNCGMACQFNTAELVPLEEIDSYVQDALDLIEFANGGVNTHWGKIRNDMGHPEPFNLKFIGVGNEQWGVDYIERYIIFTNAIKDKYPEMTIITGSGPFPSGEYFEYGWEKLKELKAEIIDEHYYHSPAWFRKNATRYDSYDRNGPKVFAGEYAAQSVFTGSPDNKNNWECALSEAAFMTGLERNADVVFMSSYAPLLAHADGWQWTPDLIWFNNLTTLKTANYEVQKLFSTNHGTEVIPMTSNGQALTGQENIYGSANLDSRTSEMILKIVNTGGDQTSVSIKVAGIKKINPEGKLICLAQTDLFAYNTFERPDVISPVEEIIDISGKSFSLTLKPYSLNILRVGIKK